MSHFLYLLILMVNYFLVSFISIHKLKSNLFTSHLHFINCLPIRLIHSSGLVLTCFSGSIHLSLILIISLFSSFAQIRSFSCSGFLITTFDYPSLSIPILKILISFFIVTKGCFSTCFSQIYGVKSFVAFALFLESDSMESHRFGFGAISCIIES